MGAARRASRPTLSCFPAAGDGTNRPLTSVLLLRSRTAETLDLAPPTLPGEPLLHRPSMGSRRLPRAADAERGAERGHESLEGQPPIPELAALVLGHRSEDRACTLDHPLLLLLRQRRRSLDVEQRLDSRLRLLCVLAPGSARPGRAESDLGARDRDAPRDLDPVGTRLARDGVNSALGGCRHVRVGVDLIEI